MHHEKAMSREMIEALGVKVDQLGPTGRFPEGRLTANDEGELALAVGVLKGKVVITFGEPVASVGMSPKQARDLAASLIQKAKALGESPARKDRRRKRRRR